MAPKFDLSTPKGMGAFNGFISSRSYVEGYAYSQVRSLVCHGTFAFSTTLQFVDVTDSRGVGSSPKQQGYGRLSDTSSMKRKL